MRNDKANTIVDTFKEKGNTIIDVIQILTELKECGKINEFKIHFDEENNTVDINVVPKQSIRYIKCNFTLSPTGMTFNE